MEHTMRKSNFEASVCRESDQHPWRFFVQHTLFTWTGNIVQGIKSEDETHTCIFDATPDGLESCLKMTDVREFMLRDVGYTREIVDAYFHACDLNAKERVPGYGLADA
jgi:hypothetical protein